MPPRPRLALSAYSSTMPALPAEKLAVDSDRGGLMPLSMPTWRYFAATEMARRMIARKQEGNSRVPRSSVRRFWVT